MRNTILTGLIAVVMMGCSNAVRSGDFQRLSEKSCVPYAEAAFKPALPIEWQPYLASTRICPLVKNAADKAEIMLVSIFIEDYYRDKPENAMWESFPKPLLFDEKGQRVGMLDELFPEESPGEMVLTYGQWQGDIPGEIRMHIINPAVTGDYDLPSLLWNREQHKYVSQELTATKDQACPKRIAGQALA